ncbi:MAG: helicase-related protein [Moorellales bacterium]
MTRLIRLYALKEGLELEAFSSFVIAPKPVVRSDPLEAVMVDVLAPEAAAKALVAHLLLYREARVLLPGEKDWRRLRLSHGAHRTFTGRVGRAVHAVVAADWLLEDGAPVAWKVPAEEVLWSLVNRGSVPVLKEWLSAGAIRALLRQYLRPMEVWGDLPGVAVWQGWIPVELITEKVRELLRKGELVIPGHVPGEAARLARCGDLDAYLAEFGRELAEKVTGRHVPLYRPGDPPDPAVGELLRRPYAAQRDVIHGVARALESRRSAVVCGEMGTGKTLIAAAVPYLAHRGRGYRVLVMCPGHLVGKWKREIQATVPGARAVVVENWREALKLFVLRPPRGPEYFVVSKETAKLGYFRRPAVVWEKALSNREEGWHCPDCGDVLRDPRTGVPLDADAFGRPRKSNYRCASCGAVLWQPDSRRVRKVSVADVVRRLPKGYFDLFVADEVHDYKGKTAQGDAFGLFAARAKKTLALTGTLLGGYAADLFYLLYRIAPQQFLREGFAYGDLDGFVARYGVVEKVTKRDDAERLWTSRSGKPRTYVYQRPGVNPALFSRHLLESTAFLELADLAIDLPEYREEVAVIPMSEDLERAYGRLQSALKALVGNAMSGRGRRHLASYLINLLAYPDRPWGNPPVLDKETGEVAVVPPELPQDVLYPKERFLLDLVKEELSRGRKVFVYLVFTETRDVADRLEKVLGDAGVKAAVLRASVEPAKREEWLAKAVASGVEVVIANAELVKTGLDLYDFPTLVFYQTGYNLYTLRQAARRSWRIGQTRPVRVVFCAYESTMQDAALRLMGRKLQAALAVEGKFSAEGLLALAEGTDMLVELARTLVSGMEDLESAEKLWRSTTPAQKDRMVRLIATVSYFKRIGGKRKRIVQEAPPDAPAAQLAFDFAVSGAG